MKILYFELNGCGTENVAMATKFLTYFDCLKFLHLYANFHLILTNNSLTIAHLNMEPICGHICDVIIFAESAVFFLRLAPSSWLFLNDPKMPQTKTIKKNFSKSKTLKNTLKTQFTSQKSSMILQ